MNPADTPEQAKEDLTVLREHVASPGDRAVRTEQAEDELGRFFDQSPDLLCIAGFDGRFKRLNPAWTACLGWTPEELEARPFIDFVHPADRRATRKELDLLGKGAETVLFENRYRHRDGSYVWLLWNARPAPGRKEIYATARDITTRRRLEREILEIVDVERERLGRELHDGLCQTLAGIAALSSTLSRRLAANSESAASAAAAEITGLLNKSISQARDLARGLGPINLRENSLDLALETLALNVQRRFRVSCTFDCDRPFVKLHHKVEAHLFRIAQEAVNNAVTHGRAGRIEISLSCRDEECLLSVRDDGIDLREETHNSRGSGLHTMAYRARRIGGSFTVRRRTGRGTAVICAFSLPETSLTREDPDHVRDTS